MALAVWRVDHVQRACKYPTCTATETAAYLYQIDRCNKLKLPHLAAATHVAIADDSRTFNVTLCCRSAGPQIRLFRVRVGEGLVGFEQLLLSFGQCTARRIEVRLQARGLLQRGGGSIVGVLRLCCLGSGIAAGR